MLVQFSKVLEKNDIGLTGSHQAGIHIPKRNKELIAFFPMLDEAMKNPDVWIDCLDDDDIEWRLRFIHYNNKFHDQNGTRDEYRLTHTTSFLRKMNAEPGDHFLLSCHKGENLYRIAVRKSAPQPFGEGRMRVALTGWSKVY